MMLARQSLPRHGEVALGGGAPTRSSRKLTEHFLHPHLPQTPMRRGSSASNLEMNGVAAVAKVEQRRRGSLSSTNGDCHNTQSVVSTPLIHAAAPVVNNNFIQQQQQLQNTQENEEVDAAGDMFFDMDDHASSNLHFVDFDDLEENDEDEDVFEGKLSLEGNDNEEDIASSSICSSHASSLGSSFRSSSYLSASEYNLRHALSSHPGLNFDLHDDEDSINELTRFVTDDEEKTPDEDEDEFLFPFAVDEREPHSRGKQRVRSISEESFISLEPREYNHALTAAAAILQAAAIDHNEDDFERALRASRRQLHCHY